MGRILVHEFITLDGVIEDPRWTFDYPFDPRMGEAIGGMMGDSKAILLGRRTYEQFAPAWSGRTAEDDPGAPFMNETPKYVVSGTLENADWSNSAILGAYSAESIRSLKGEVDGDIYVAAAARSFARCSRTDSSTGCTCSCSRSCSVRGSGCSTKARR
jgi:dihydrofolate reductase